MAVMQADIINDVKGSVYFATDPFVYKAELSSRSDSMEQFEEMDMDMVLGNIFAVD